MKAVIATFFAFGLIGALAATGTALAQTAAPAKPAPSAAPAANAGATPAANAGSLQHPRIKHEPIKHEAIKHEPIKHIAHKPGSGSGAQTTSGGSAQGDAGDLKAPKTSVKYGGP